MSAPMGSNVGIYYDGALLQPGDALRTPSGRLYHVVERRIQRKGKHIGRQHLRCLVVAEVSEGTRVLPIHWYKRKKRTPGGQE